MPDSFSKKILIVPLDWGLGHTTRCIPIIRVLLGLGHRVHIGGTEDTNALLKKEFQSLKLHSFPSYGISYPKDGSKFLRQILKLSPQIARVVRQEKRIAMKLQQEFSFDVIISDNRFGVRANNCKNVFISHQLNLSVPQSAMAERVANYINQSFINKFDIVGVPDWEGQLLSGTLSNSRTIDKPVVFLGGLSRWQVVRNTDMKGIVAILSGPEPQRSMLEDLLVIQAKKLSKPITIVRAKPNEVELPVNEFVTFYNHMASKDLQDLVAQSEVVISRAGYTTILDLIAVRKNGILIPTPGQTEQEYLAKHLDSMRLFTFYSQEKFDLSKALQDYKSKEWGHFPEMENKLEEKIKQLIA